MHLLIVSAGLGTIRHEVLSVFDKMSELKVFAEGIDLFVLCVLGGDFGSVTAAFSSFLQRTVAVAQTDLTPHI